MAKAARTKWRRPGSPIGKKGPRKAHPKYTRNKETSWTDSDVRTLRTLARTIATRVIGLKLGRTEGSVRTKALREGFRSDPPIVLLTTVAAGEIRCNSLLLCWSV